MKKGLIVLAILFVGFIIYRLPAGFERQKTEETVEFIQSQKITMEDVDGSNLPPVPDPSLVDATVEGIDANENGIRDDVEVAIFDRYPNNIKVRSAMLQYAMGLQLELTYVFNSETWEAVTQQIGRGFGCIYDSLNNPNTKTVSDKKIEIENLIRNTKKRENRYESLDKFQTSFSLPNDLGCDISLI